LIILTHASAGRERVHREFSARSRIARGDRRVHYAEQLYDELHLWVYPIVLGEGAKVFPSGAVPSRLRLIEPPLTGSSGATLLRYAPLPGEPETGTIEA